MFEPLKWLLSLKWLMKMSKMLLKIRQPRLAGFLKNFLLMKTYPYDMTPLVGNLALMGAHMP